MLNANSVGLNSYLIFPRAAMASRKESGCFLLLLDRSPKGAGEGRAVSALPVFVIGVLLFSLFSLLDFLSLRSSRKGNLDPEGHELGGLLFSSFFAAFFFLISSKKDGLGFCVDDFPGVRAADSLDLKDSLSSSFICFLLAISAKHEEGCCVKGGGDCPPPPRQLSKRVRKSWLSLITGLIVEWSILSLFGTTGVGASRFFLSVSLFSLNVPPSVHVLLISSILVCVKGVEAVCFTFTGDASGSNGPVEGVFSSPS